MLISMFCIRILMFILSLLFSFFILLLMVLRGMRWGVRDDFCFFCVSCLMIVFKIVWRVSQLTLLIWTRGCSCPERRVLFSVGRWGFVW